MFCMRNNTFYVGAVRSQEHKDYLVACACSEIKEHMAKRYANQSLRDKLSQYGVKLDDVYKQKHDQKQTKLTSFLKGDEDSGSEHGKNEQKRKAAEKSLSEAQEGRKIKEVRQEEQEGGFRSCQG